MENNDKNNTGTQLSTQIDIAGRIMAPADFKALDGLIQSLGDNSAKLSEEEKTAAIAVIDEWDKSVTARIQSNAERARSVLAFLDGSDMYGRQLDDAIELFHEAVGDVPEYIAVKDAEETLSDVMRGQPLEVPVDGGMSVAQAEKVQMDNYAAKLAYNRQLKGAQHMYFKAVKAFVKYLNTLPEIKAIRGNLSSYKNKASYMAAECSDKATRAKLNVSINNNEVRQVLHDMMDFAKGI